MPLDDVAAAMRSRPNASTSSSRAPPACAVAAALSGRAGRGKVVAVVSGGNIDLSRFAELVGAAARGAG